MMFFVYMLECADGSYYVGSHREERVEDRVAAHDMGLDPKAYTFNRRPVTCIWSEVFDDPSDMVATERRLKGWTRAKKEALIRGDIQTLKVLAHSKTAPADPGKSRLTALIENDAAERNPQRCQS